MEEVERGERGGVVLDGSSENEGLQPIEDLGGSDVKDTSDSEIDKAIDEQGGAADLERGTEDSEVGADDKGEEGEILENGEKPGTPNPDRLALVENTLKEIHAKINEKQPEAPKPMSDEDWAKLEQQTGAPRSTIEFFTNQNVKVVNHLKEYIDSAIAKLSFGSAIDEFAKTPGFQDATRYKKDIQEFLNTYEPKHWTNPEVLKRAVIYSRGLNANANLQKVRNDSERNRKIAGVGRPAAPAGGIRKPALPPLNQAQKEAAALMGSEAEYNKYRSKGRVVIE